MHLRAAALLAVFAAAPPPGPGQPLSAPDAVLARVEAAVRGGDGDGLAGLAPPGGRVLVDLAAPRPVRGTFGAGQLAVVLGRVFEQVSTSRFEFDPAGRQLEGATLFARARWLWRDERESAVTLVVTLEWRSSAWRLVELRSAP